MRNKELTHMSWLDVAKGIGIIFVVIGHAIFPKHLIIDGFHMTLFFILSGITFSTKDTFINFVKKKFTRILLPCMFWGLVWISTGIPNIPIWFLYTIFFGLILLYLITKYLHVWLSAAFVLSVSLLLCGEYSILSEVNYQIARIIVGTTYIYIGYLIRLLICIDQRDWFCGLYCKIKRLIQNRLIISVAAIMLSMLYLLVVLGGEYLGYYRNLSFGKMTLFQINWLLMMFITLSGSFATVLFAILLQNNNVLQYFGKSSLVIMCVHFPLAEKLNSLISSMPHFNRVIYKLGYGIIEYMILFSFCVIMVFLCNRYLPMLTGGIKKQTI